MQYLIVFLEGIITFASPCLLPMLPVFLLYFAGGEVETKRSRIWMNALGFVAGFTIVFVLLGLFAGSIGRLLRQHKTVFNLATGAIVVLFGLSFLGAIKLPALKIGKENNIKTRLGFFSAILFGMIFSLSWTPCTGAFLGSALALASSQGSVLQGALMLLVYSMGLGIPFILSVLTLDRLKSSFAWIKNHYKAINAVAGTVLIIIGIAMMTGYLDKLLTALA